MFMAAVKTNKAKGHNMCCGGKVVLVELEEEIGETLWPFVQPLLMANFSTKSLHSDFSPTELLYL